MSVFSSFVTGTERRECGACKVHFSSQLSACPNCGRSTGESVQPRKRRFAPGSRRQPRS